MGNQIQTVDYVDLSQYLGTWYEVARKPFKYEDPEAFNVTATYSLEDDYIKVVNTEYFRKGNSLPLLKSSIGKAYPTDKTNSKLKVSFIWPFQGNYWVIKLGPNYEYSVVSNSDGSNLWVLSRTKILPELYQILNELKEKGFDVDDIILTPQF